LLRFSIQRSLPEFTLSCAEGVEMTGLSSIRAVTARNHFGRLFAHTLKSVKRAALTNRRCWAGMEIAGATKLGDSYEDDTFFGGALVERFTLGMRRRYCRRTSFAANEKIAAGGSASDLTVWFHSPKRQRACGGFFANSSPLAFDHCTAGRAAPSNFLT
jgi:hypothetical protein